MGDVVGINLGTTNSVVAVVRSGEVEIVPSADGQRLHPSVVAFKPNGERLVGMQARLRRIIDPRNTIFSAKRLIGQPFRAPSVQAAIGQLPYEVVEGAEQESLVVTRAGHHTVVEISSMLLAHLRELAERHLGELVSSCVVTVPANFSDGQREATRRAAERAGMKVIRILNEPTAAALAYGMGASAGGEPLDQRIVVFDMGGGTFDITILAVRQDLFEVIATGGDPFLGGDDMDHLLADSLAQQFLVQQRVDLRARPEAQALLLVAAEQIKAKLSSQDSVAGTLKELAHGEGGAKLSLDYKVSRAQFEEMIEPLVDRALVDCEAVLEEAGLSASQVDEVVLVGGATRVPLVRQRVSEYFGCTPRADVDPMEAVARGAALQASYLSGPSLPPLPPARPVALPPARPVALPPARPVALPPARPVALPPPPPAELELEPRPAARAPLLVDVTPHSLGLAIAGGYNDVLIERNHPIPVERTRVFTTARDGQDHVVIRVCQGADRSFAANTPLGELRLAELRTAPRGEVKIEVTFLVDADGILQVSARDLTTGRDGRATLRVLGLGARG